MKKLLLLFASLLILQSGFANEWYPYGPGGIKANKIIFFSIVETEAVILTDTGFYYVDYLGDYQYFSFQVKDICVLNANTLLVITGGNSYSDGIYTFDLINCQFDVVYYCMNGKFIEHNDYFFAGTGDGLLVSQDGLSWTNVPFFDGKSCISISNHIYPGNPQNQIAVATEDSTDNVYNSINTGVTWQQMSSPFMISKVFYGFNNIPIGICAGNSVNSGLYVGNSLDWELKYQTQNLNAGRFDNAGNLFLGWHGATGSEEGVAVGVFNANPLYLTFLNEGLPNLNINSFATQFEWVSDAIIFCCTDNGVYVSNDYYTGISEQKTVPDEISVYPNPVTGTSVISIPETDAGIVIIFNAQGVKVNEIKPGQNASLKTTIKWNKGDLPAGVYYLVVKTGKKKFSKKFIIL